jgi:UDP-glucose 4-epimerase
MKNILITGGLGFIGSHTVVSLMENGFNPIVIDNLSNSQLSVLDGIESITGSKPVFFNVDVNDKAKVNDIFQQYKIETVVHFAAYKAVGESVEFPLKYYKNNVGGLISLLEVMESNACKNIVFSSSCTVYGEPETLPVSENSPIVKPNSPYGNTKKICEEILQDQKNIKVISLRYFNPIGAHSSSLIGELPIGVPNNLVPFITQTAIGIRQKLTVYGDNYSTPDGSCIRDYLHVCDLADAHVLAIQRLSDSEFGKLEGNFETYNLGTGTGYSVKEVIHTFEEVTGTKLNYEIGPRRMGDVEKVWANPKKANEYLKWKTKRDIKEMIQSAWNWQKNLK